MSRPLNSTTPADVSAATATGTGNPAATNQQDKATLWADYAGVWHLGEDQPGLNGAAEVYKDSTTNACHGKDWVSTNSVAGRVGNGANLDGDDYVALIRTLYTTNDFTITAWPRPTRTDWEPIIGDSSSRYFMLHTATALIGRSSISNGGHQVVYGNNAILTTNTWHHVVYRSTGEAGATPIPGLSTGTAARVPLAPSISALPHERPPQR